MEKDKFIEVIKENRNLIFKVCYTYCRDQENRKDLEQEILFQLWKSFEKFDGRVKISTWIYRIALNTAISFYRNDNKYIGKTVAFDESIISVSSHEQDLEQDENITLLYQFIDKLSVLDKALMLLYLDNNKYMEIADILGISESNVATKISRIKKTLKNQFDIN
jgi:RNA polymerase sigma-70 factor (ECF subfamily)